MVPVGAAVCVAIEATRKPFSDRHLLMARPFANGFTADSPIQVATRFPNHHYRQRLAKFPSGLRRVFHGLNLLHARTSLSRMAARTCLHLGSLVCASPSAAMRDRCDARRMRRTSRGYAERYRRKSSYRPCAPARRSMRRGRPSALRKRQRSNRVVKRATGPDFPRVKRSSRAGREAKAWHRALVDGIAQKGFGDCEVSIVGGPHTPDTPMTHPLNQCEKSHAKS